MQVFSVFNIPGKIRPWPKNGINKGIRLIIDKFEHIPLFFPFFF
ncbi:hypothetical protein CFter6_4209 [Collimonas fungivorans]|uniref:Uncharacterized protein n=1 Tax=Collimonas fungivorans TaxID=158899 RepID=A0A127PG74_9BURK|nr:hypothetical protein CFter6_4209 [Collimonas fungivorans]